MSSTDSHIQPLFDTIPDQKIAYLVLRKCACSSVIATMEKIRNPVVQLPDDPLDVAALHQPNKPSWARPEQLDGGKEWFSFTLVRDPIRRYLSFYAHKVLHPTFRGSATIANPEVFGYRTNMSLDDAIAITTSEKFTADPHAFPLSRTIDSVGFTLDLIGKVEQSEKAFADISKKSGVEFQNLHLNQHQFPPLLPTRKQFDALSEYYHEDQTRFEYETDYEQWCQQQVGTRKGEFDLEEGHEFENEAKLLEHHIERTSQGFRLRLKWRVNENHRLRRCIALKQDIDGDRQTLGRLPNVESLLPLADKNGIAEEEIEFSLHQFDAEHLLDEVYLLIFFGRPDDKSAPLKNFSDTFGLILPLN